eukprot:GEMP01005866.1.p1 GENE.GEMP01005866.1~~GEMP01005866.1.p1  ORF type:complete len:1042 (+),score=278.98 GEMP01005866.1:462-3587(+)
MDKTRQDSGKKWKEAGLLSCNSEVVDKANSMCVTSMQQENMPLNSYMPCFELPMATLSCQSWESYPCTMVAPADAPTYTPTLEFPDIFVHHDQHQGRHQHLHLHLHQHEHQHHGASSITPWENSSVPRQPWPTGGGIMPASAHVMLPIVKNANFQSGGAVSSASPVVQQQQQQYYQQEFPQQYQEPQQHYGPHQQYQQPFQQPLELHLHQPPPPAPQVQVQSPQQYVQQQYVQQLPPSLPQQQYFQQPQQQWATAPTPHSHVHLPNLIHVASQGQPAGTGDDRVYLPITKREDTITTRRNEAPWTCIGCDPAACPHAHKARAMPSEDTDSMRYDPLDTTRGMPSNDATQGGGLMGDAEDIDLWMQEEDEAMEWHEDIDLWMQEEDEAMECHEESDEWMHKETQWIPQGHDAERRIEKTHGTWTNQEHQSMVTMLPLADMRQRSHMNYRHHSGVEGQHNSPELIKEKKDALERQLVKLEKKQREIERLRQRPFETLDTFMQAKVHLDVAPALAKVRERLRNLVGGRNGTENEFAPVVCTPTTSAGAWDDARSCLDTVSSVSDPIDPKLHVEHSFCVKSDTISIPPSTTTVGRLVGVPTSQSKLTSPTHQCPPANSRPCHSAHSGAGEEPPSLPESKKTRKKRHNEKQALKKERACNAATPQQKLDRTRLGQAQHEDAEADERISGATGSTDGAVVSEGATGSIRDNSGEVAEIAQPVRKRLGAPVIMTWLAVTLVLCFGCLLYSKASLLYSRRAFAAAVAASRNYDWETEVPHGKKLVAVVQQECTVEAKRIEAKIRNDREARQAKKENAKTTSATKKSKNSAKKKKNEDRSNRAPTTIDHITASMRDFLRNPDADDDTSQQDTFVPLSAPWLRIGRAFFEQSKTLFQHLDVNGDRRLNKHEMVKGLAQKVLDQWGRRAPESIMLSFGCSIDGTASSRVAMGTEPNFGRRTTTGPSGISDRSTCKPCALPFQADDCFLFVQQFTEFVYLYHAERRMSSLTSSFYAQNAKHMKGYKHSVPAFATQDARRILQMVSKFYPNFRL